MTQPTYMCHICSHFYSESEATIVLLERAADLELKWAEHPLEVEEFTCPECGETLHWWYFDRRM